MTIANEVKALGQKLQKFSGATGEAVSLRIFVSEQGQTFYILNFSSTGTDHKFKTAVGAGAMLDAHISGDPSVLTEQQTRARLERVLARTQARLDKLGE